LECCILELCSLYLEFFFAELVLFQMKLCLGMYLVCSYYQISMFNFIWLIDLLGSSSAWWNEVTCTGLFSFGLGLFLLILNCLISRKEEEDLEDYVHRQLTRSRSGNMFLYMLMRFLPHKINAI